jgi:hypothetical protein
MVGSRSRGETIVRYLTPLASDGQAHLTDNGAVTLCGRAITHKWRRGARTGERACDACQKHAIARGAAHVASRRVHARGVQRAVPA